MKYKSVSKIKEQISVIGLGCWGFSGESYWGERSAEKNCIDTIRAALDLDVNLLDTAPVYGRGRSETVVGKAIKGYDRSKIIIATKCGLLWNESGEYNYLKKDSVLSEIDDSLKRLDTDYIDIYQLHWPDPSTPIEETLEAIRAIMDAGKVRYFGVSNFAIDDVAAIEKIIPVSSQQSLYNMLERNARTYHPIDLVYRTEREILPYCLKNGQAFLPYSPFMQGLLGGHWAENRVFGDDDVRRFNPKLAGERYLVFHKAMTELKKISEKYGRPMSETAVNWLVRNPAVTSVIATCLSPEQIKGNVKSLEWEISGEMSAEIDKVLEPFEDM